MSKKFKDSRFSIDIEETGKRLKKFRISHNITLSELAQQSGLSQAMLSETEAGKNKPSPNLMLAMHRIFGLNIHWLLTGEGEPLVKQNTTRPPMDKNGDIICDTDSLLWLMDRVPMVKFAILTYFSMYYFDNKEQIAKMLKPWDEKSPVIN
jgi:transcriptional regulator with XRE-family HTH domain